MTILIRTTLLRAVAALSLAGCSASTPAEPASPARSGKHTEAKQTPTPSSDTTRSGGEVGESRKQAHDGAAASAPPAQDEPGSWTRKASRPPAELITGPNLVYTFNFKESPIGKSARERCEEEVGNDGAALSACLDKARKKIPVEAIRFVKKPSGELWWITYNRYKGNLLAWHKVQFQPGEEGDDRITLNLIGKDKGIAPMARVPRTLEIELPNDYTIVVKDPEFGPMLYDAKIGTIEDE